MKSQQRRVPDEIIEYDENLVYSVDGERFTGIGFDDESGKGLSEISYVDGLQEGPSRDWYSNGKLRGEAIYKENVLHGLTREFAEDGTLLREARYEYGILVSEIKRDNAGNVISTFVLAETAPIFDLLKKYRQETNWPS